MTVALVAFVLYSVVLNPLRGMGSQPMVRGPEWLIPEPITSASFAGLAFGLWWRWRILR